MALGKKLDNILTDYFGDEEINLKDLQPHKSVIELDQKTQLQQVPIAHISVSKYQTRIHFDDAKIKSLADNINDHGLIHPVVVIKHENQENQFVLLAGERRLRACQLLGWETIWAVIKPFDSLSPSQQAMLTATENLQREDLSSIELAKTYEMLITTQGISEQELGEMIAKSGQYIRNHIKLLTLCEGVQKALLTKKIGEGHARFLVGLEEIKQLTYLNIILAKELTVKEVQKMIAQEEAKRLTQPPSMQSHNISPHILTKAQKIAEDLNEAKIKCMGDDTKGRITITWG